VRLLLHHNDNITWLGSWVLISFSMVGELGVVWSTFVDIDIDNFLLLHNLLSIASLALVGVINDLTFTTAVITRTLALRVHSWPELGHFGDDSSTSASSTLLDGSLFASKTVAFLANTLSVNCNFGCFSIVNLFESTFHWVHHWLSLLWSRLLWA